VQQYDVKSRGSGQISLLLTVIKQTEY